MREILLILACAAISWSAVLRNDAREDDILYRIKLHMLRLDRLEHAQGALEAATAREAVENAVLLKALSEKVDRLTRSALHPVTLSR